MASVNKVIIVGHLGRDPEVRFTANDQAVANFSVATTESWKDKSGDKQEKTEWHKLTAWGKLAEIIGEYLKKGSLGYFEGKLQTRKWQDKDGADRYTTEIVVERMQILGGGSRDRDDDRDDDRDRGRSSGRRDSTDRGSSKPSGKQSRFDDLEDDIPF